MQHEIAALCGCAWMVLVGSACSNADILLGWRSRVGESAGSGAVVTDAGSGTMAAAGSAGNANMTGAAGNFAQAGSNAGMSAAVGGAGASAAGAGGTASLVSASRGCGTDPPTTDTSIPVSGTSASYIVDKPLNYDKTRPYPLVIAFRGSNVTAEQFRGDLNLPQIAGVDAILVHPNPLGDAANWSVQRDLPLFDMLLAQTVARYCVDEGRVFAAGQGFGGYFASMLGCLRANKLRAIAAFAPGVPPSSTCQGDVAIWMAQAKADTQTAVTNGRNTSAFWAKHNGCDATMSTGVEPSPCREFAGCRPGFAVRFCEYDGDLALPPFAASGLWGFFKSL